MVEFSDRPPFITDSTLSPLPNPQFRITHTTVPVLKSKHICSQYLPMSIHLRSAFARVSDVFELWQEHLIRAVIFPAIHQSGKSRRQIVSNSLMYGWVYVCSRWCMYTPFGGQCVCGAVSRLCIVGLFVYVFYQNCCLKNMKKSSDFLIKSSTIRISEMDYDFHL